jgi:hypothetical protein
VAELRKLGRFAETGLRIAAKDLPNEQKQSAWELLRIAATQSPKVALQ